MKFLVKCIPLFMLTFTAVVWADSTLIGKTLEIKYPGGYVYEVTYKPNTLIWKATSGPELGRTEENKYDWIKVKEGSYLVRWRESDGVIVHSLINLKEKTVFSSILQAEFYDYLLGTITILTNEIKNKG